MCGDSVPLLADKNTLKISVCGVCLLLCLHTPVCTRHVHRSEKRVVGVLPCVSTYSLETVSHWIWSSPSWLSWLRSACLCSPVLGLCDHATWSCGFVGIKLRFSHVHSKCSYLLIGPHRSTNCLYKAREFQVGNEGLDVGIQNCWNYWWGYHR